MQALIDYSRSGESDSLRSHFLKSMPPVVVDIDVSQGNGGALSRRLITEGWTALLLEQDPAFLANFKATVEVTANARFLSFAYRGEENGDKSHSGLDRILSENGVLGDFGLLILNKPGTGFATLQSFDTERFRPWLIATADNQEGAAERAAKYTLLVERGYVYSGLSDNYSVWRRKCVKAVSDTTPPPSVLLPQLSHRNGAYSMFDLPANCAQLTAAGPTDLCLRGWAFLEVSKPVPPLVFLELEDIRTGLKQYVQGVRYPRVDVALHFKEPNLLMSGFRAVVSMRRMRSNDFKVRVVQSEGDALYWSETEVAINRGMEEFERFAREGLARKYLRGSGIEIGALQRRLPLGSSCKVRYMDRMPLDDLLKHYPELNGLPLQPPDLIDDGEQLRTISQSSQDFVIANHFFEHSENPIQTLTNLLRVLKPGGVLFLAVPDKRFTFDSYRPTTDYEVLKQTYRSGIRADRAQLYKEWVESVELNGAQSAEARAMELMRTKYSIHFNVWSADELFEFLLRARSEFSLPFRVTAVVSSDNEIITLLERE